jgi:hypothetical protein
VDFFLFSTFFCKIKLISIKFLRDSCEIPVFQREPHTLAASYEVTANSFLDAFVSECQVGANSIMDVIPSCILNIVADYIVMEILDSKKVVTS